MKNRPYGDVNEGIRLKVLQVTEEGLPGAAEAFIRNHQHRNWFTYNALIPGPLVTGNSVFFLFIAEDKQGIAGVIVANLYYRVYSRKVAEEPFRLQINGAPMIKEDHPAKSEILAGLLGEVKNFTSRLVETVEFRNFPVSPGEKNIFESSGFRYEAHLNLIKPLTTNEEAWYSLSKCRRRQIRKSLKNGTRVIVADEISQVRQMYRILYHLYSHKIHKKLPPFRTFADFFFRSNKMADGVILVVLSGETVIGGIVCLLEEHRSLTEWYVCGLDHTFKDHYPSVLATWAGIRYACEKGLPVFNFLGLGKPTIPYGVRDFKLRFGGEVADYGRFVLEYPNSSSARPAVQSS